jgi:hypothetical protein
MRKLAIALAVTVTVLLAVGSKPAEAHCHQDCPAWLDAIGYTLAAGIVGGYAYGTGYFIYRDATDDRQSLDYAAAELGFNTAFAALFTTATADAIEHRQPGRAAAYGALALTHGVLAGHGVWSAYQHRGELRPEPTTIARFAGLAYATNTVIWGLQLPGEHGRGYGIAEAAVNAPLAAGLGYLAVDRARGGDTRQAALFGGMAAISAGLALHGAYTAIFQRPRHEEPIDFGLDLGLGADVAPTVVTDGKEVAPGIGASGTW